jgi:hypothetical protein
MLDLVLGPTVLSKPLNYGCSGLCYDGFPLQVCVSISSDGTDIILVGDPFSDIPDMVLRVSRSLENLENFLNLTQCHGLQSLVSATIDAFVPHDSAGRNALPLGALWLAAGISRISFALYTCASWGSNLVHKWDRVDDWAGRVLTQSGRAQTVVRSLRSIAIPSSACIEGVDSAHARVKVYFRLITASAIGGLSFLPIANAKVESFLESVIREFEIPLQGLVFSVGFLAATGEIYDSKIDICCHCVVRKPSEWKAVFVELARSGYPIDLELLIPMIDSEYQELACLGIGSDVRGRTRVNTYWKPRLPVTERLMQRVPQSQKADAAKG